MTVMEAMSGALLATFFALVIVLIASSALVIVLVMADMLRDFWRYWRSS